MDIPNFQVREMKKYFMPIRTCSLKFIFVTHASYEQTVENFHLVIMQKKRMTLTIYLPFHLQKKK
jgi:hypothetical protein